MDMYLQTFKPLNKDRKDNENKYAIQLIIDLPRKENIIIQL